MTKVRDLGKGEFITEWTNNTLVLFVGMASDVWRSSRGVLMCEALL